MNAVIAERLRSVGVQVMADGEYFCVFIRDGCIAMAPRSEDKQGFASIGSSGLATDDGLLYLVWRGDAPVLVGRSVVRPAEAEQVERILRFSADLKAALGLE